MAVISKDEFLQWKSNNVTQLLFEHLKEMIEEGSYVIAHRTEPDELQDFLIRGKIIAFEDILNISFEE